VIWRCKDWPYVAIFTNWLFEGFDVWLVTCLHLSTLFTKFVSNLNNFHVLFYAQQCRPWMFFRLPLQIYWNVLINTFLLVLQSSDDSRNYWFERFHNSLNVTSLAGIEVHLWNFNVFEIFFWRFDISLIKRNSVRIWIFLQLRSYTRF
jgi:hypothetical protein